MFAYCRNNPVCRVDISGTADTISYNDGELLSNDELDCRGHGGGSSTIYNESYKDYQASISNSSSNNSECTVIGGGHGNPAHAGYINNMINDLASSGNYRIIYGNRSLSTAGLNGLQRPDIIAVHYDGHIEVWEVASPSQSMGSYGYNALVAKIDCMYHANPSVNFHDIIPWEVCSCE